jgi:hypothetical protein
MNDEQTFTEQIRDWQDNDVADEVFLNQLTTDRHSSLVALGYGIVGRVDDALLLDLIKADQLPEDKQAEAYARLGLLTIDRYIAVSDGQGSELPRL